MIDVRPAAARFETVQPGITTHQCLSSGAHYDPDNTAFGALIAVDEHTLAPGAGFSRHGHRGIEIVSWVLAGTLRHEDSAGRVELVGPGPVLYQSAGSGIEHTERNASATEALRFVQMWLLGETGRPAHAVTEPPLRADAGTFTVLRPSGPSQLPAAPLVHLYVARGAVRVAGETLGSGDSVRVRDEQVAIDGAGELLVWSMHQLNRVEA